MASSRHIQSGEPSGELTQWLHSSVSVSTMWCPRWPSICTAVDLPVPDIPVTRTLDMLRGYDGACQPGDPGTSESRKLRPVHADFGAPGPPNASAWSPP